MVSELSSATVYSTDDSSSSAEVRPFAATVREYTQAKATPPAFDGTTRKAMEPYLRLARMRREKTRNATHLKVDACIASSVGVPYTVLRKERPFLFDANTHPLHELLAKALHVRDLSLIHEESSPSAHGTTSLLAPLLEPRQRYAFHAAYDTFVRSHCIPLLHELAMSKRLFHTTTPSNCITYRYQAFPNIEINQPTAFVAAEDQGTHKEPSCDVADGHSIGCLKFHVPLTPSFGTNALYTESHPGREDWHPLSVKSVGLGYIFDGARCLHFSLDNTTHHASRVSLEFRVLMYCNKKSKSRLDGDSSCSIMDDGVFTPPELVPDALSRAGPGYYNETFPDWTTYADHDDSNHRPLWTPDARCGAPFDESEP